VEKVIKLIEQDYNATFIEAFLKERTGATLDDFYNDEMYLRWALGVDFPNSYFLLYFIYNKKNYCIFILITINLFKKNNFLIKISISFTT
jgi:hypothetical protein